MCTYTFIFWLYSNEETEIIGADDQVSNSGQWEWNMMRRVVRRDVSVLGIDGNCLRDV